MSLSSNNAISKVVLGRLSEASVGLIKLIDKLIKIKFKITEIEKDDYDEDSVEEEENDIENMEDIYEDNSNFDENEFKEEKQLLPR